MCSTCMCLMYLKLLLIAPLQRVKNWLEDVTRWWLLIKLWFRLPSASAKGAVMTAQKLLEWSSQPESNCVFGPFSCELVEGLDDCLRVNRRNLQSRQEFMWKNLFKFHSSPEFWSKWSDFLLSSILVFSPLQFFFTSLWLINSLLKQCHRIDMSEDKGIEASLSYEEKNALRYAASYVTRALRKKIKHSSNST